MKTDLLPEQEEDFIHVYFSYIYVYICAVIRNRTVCENQMETDTARSIHQR